MPEPTDPTIDDQPGDDSPVIRELRRKAEEGQGAKRELAFVKAGIDTDSPMGQLIMSGYKGDLTPDAIKQYVGTLGLPAAPSEPTPPPSIDETDQALAQARQGLGDADPPSSPDDLGEDPNVVGLREFNKLVKAGVPRQRAGHELVGRLLESAAKGDPRALYDPARYADRIVAGDY